jgi:peptidoglycan/xylan/chitin deacetylase (PgdA/CDA1 family)
VSRDPRRVARRLLANLRAGDVLLLHDGSGARDRLGAPVVLEALRRLLDELAARGLRAVALPRGAAAEDA